MVVEVYEQMEDEGKYATQILEYLKAHPHAGDTLEGITRWWMVRQRLNESIAIVKRALEMLKSKGCVLERKTPDGRTLYFARGREEQL